MLTAMPLETKGSNLRGQAEHLTRFSLMMNHVDKLELVADSEPTMLSLCQNVSLMRQHLGFQTIVSHGRPGDKGRTAQIERAIQTLRRQASTLLHMAEQKCELQLPGSHALVPWSYMHAAWLLNRFHNHSTIKTSPLQLAFGRSYPGRVACFGQTVIVLHRRGVNCKAGPQWIPGIWLGKSEQEDVHIVATPEGIIRGKATRRTAEPWRGVWLFMVNQKPYQPSGRKSNLRSLRLGSPATPKPVIDIQPGKADETIDYDAKDVIEYAKKHPKDSDREDGDDVEVGETAGLKREKMEGSFEPRKSARTDEVDSGQASSGHKRSSSASASNKPDPLLDIIPAIQSQFKVPRLSPESSPTPGPLYSPNFAGSINNVEFGVTDDDQWEQDISWTMRIRMNSW